MNTLPRKKRLLRAVPPSPKPPPPKRPDRRVAGPVRKPAVMEYQPDAIELEARKPPFLARTTLYGVVLAIGAAIFWASVSNIDEIVVAPGKLVTVEPMMVVQPLETSIIRGVHVKQGDIVRRGQLLATLDPTITSADAGQLRAKVAAFEAQVDRLNAELAGQAYIPPKQATSDEITQGQLAAQRTDAYEARLRDFDAQIAHAGATLAAAKDEERVLVQRLAGLKEIDAMRSALYEQGSGSRLAYLQGRDLSFDTEVAITRIRGQQAGTAEMLAQLAAQRLNFVEDYRRVALENLVDLKDRQVAATEELKKAELRQEMATMLAPADAAVLEIAHRSIGSVIQAAEPLFTLVPLNVPLEAEVSVAANDIGHLSAGDPARVKFDAFPFQKHGTMDGEVVSISHDSFGRENQADGSASAAAFYRVRLSLADASELRSLPEGFRLLPGMTILVEINAGQRSVISYFLYPLIRGLDESLHEP